MKVYPFRVAGEPVTVYFPTSRDDVAGFPAWLADQGRHPVAVDTETTGLAIYRADWSLRLVQFGTRSEAWVLRWDLFADVIRAALASDRLFVFHNAAYDALVLDRAHATDASALLARTFDTRLLAHLLDPRGKEEGGVGLGLKDLSALYVDGDAPDTAKGLHEVFRKEYRATIATGWRRIDVDHPTYVLYAGLDVILASRLFEVLAPMVRERGLSRLAQFEHLVQGVTVRMTRRGFLLDVPYTERLAEDLAGEAAEARVRAARFGVANVDAPRQVAEALQGMGWTPQEFTPGGQPKVDKAVLGALAKAGNPLAEAVMAAKRAAKFRETYAVSMLDLRDESDRVHADISSLQARTARMSISRPPLQQLPSKEWRIRRALLADPGHVIVSVDYQAVEMRVLAALADVRKMKEAIRDGHDLHGFTADLVFGAGNWGKKDRDLMKGVGFGKVYGGGADTLSRQTGAPLEDVRRAVAAYDRVYPEVKRYGRRLMERAEFGRREVVTPSGRRLPLDRDRLYAATNYVVQSTARDLLAQALLQLEEDGLGDYLRLPIHDEVVASVPAAEAADVARAIATAMAEEDFMGVPIDTDADIGGRSWGSLYGAPDDPPLPTKKEHAA